MGRFAKDQYFLDTLNFVAIDFFLLIKRRKDKTDKRIELISIFVLFQILAWIPQKRLNTICEKLKLMLQTKCIDNLSPFFSRLQIFHQNSKDSPETFRNLFLFSDKILILSDKHFQKNFFLQSHHWNATAFVDG